MRCGKIAPRPHIHIADAFQVKTGSGYCTRSQFFNQIP